MDEMVIFKWVWHCLMLFASPFISNSKFVLWAPSTDHSPGKQLFKGGELDLSLLLVGWVGCIFSSYRIDSFESNLNFYGQQCKCGPSIQIGGCPVVSFPVLVEVDLKVNDCADRCPFDVRKTSTKICILFLKHILRTLITLILIVHRLHLKECKRRLI